METERVRSLYYNPDADTLDVWMDDPTSEASSSPVTENVVAKLDQAGRTIGFEIISLRRLSRKDMRSLPEAAKTILRESSSRLSVVKQLG